MRSETRQERYQKKELKASKLPCSIATVNFMYEDNIAFTIRSMACFGLQNLYIIGSVPPRPVIYPKSGSLSDRINIVQFKTPGEFLDFSRKKNLEIVAAELDDESVNLFDYKFQFSKETVIVLGHEMVGVPIEILKNSKKVFIPMLGSGYSLNTSQTGTAFMTEYSRQYIKNGG